MTIAGESVGVGVGVRVAAGVGVASGRPGVGVGVGVVVPEGCGDTPGVPAGVRRRAPTTTGMRGMGVGSSATVASARFCVGLGLSAPSPVARQTAEKIRAQTIRR